MYDIFLCLKYIYFLNETKNLELQNIFTNVDLKREKRNMMEREVIKSPTSVHRLIINIFLQIEFKAISSKYTLYLYLLVLSFIISLCSK